MHRICRDNEASGAGLLRITVALSTQYFGCCEPECPGVTCPYKMRYLVENCFLSLERWRGIATRYAKTSDAFIAAVHVRCIAIWAAIRA